MVVEHGNSGLLVRPEDAKELASAINTLLDNPEMVTGMGLEGRKIVEQRFSEEVVIPQLIKEYRSVID